MDDPERPQRRPLLQWGAVFNFVLVVGGLSCLGIGAVTLGGSKIRPLFGASARALAGPQVSRHLPDGGAADAGSPW